jgi:hypothetical protein
MNSHQRRIVRRIAARGESHSRLYIAKAVEARPSLAHCFPEAVKADLLASFRLIVASLFRRRLRHVPEPFFPPDGYADQNCMNCERLARCPVACSGDKCPGGRRAHPSIARRNREQMNAATRREEHYQRTQGWVS